jgi:hypothetical protein
MIRRDALQPFLYRPRTQLQQDGQGNPEHRHKNNDQINGLYGSHLLFTQK